MSKTKQNIKSLIEMLHLGKAVDKLRFYKQYYSKKNQIDSFVKKHDVPLPTPFMIYETFKLDYERYWNSGQEDAQWIIHSIAPFKDLNNKRILDWGCGPARVIRHFHNYLTDPTLFGSDYNIEYIQWCQKNIGNIEFKTNGLNPPLSFKANSFDMVYSISIFTHLSEKSHYLWMDEIYRVLDTDGIFFFTTHGDITQQNLLEDEILKYKKGEIVIRGSVTEGYRMYCAYHPIPFIKKLLKDKFQILKHIPGEKKEWGLSQDVWIVKKLSH